MASVRDDGNPRAQARVRFGGYTTFSAFSLDAALLYERGELGLAALYVLGSVALSIAGLFGGLALVRSLT